MAYASETFLHDKDCFNASQMFKQLLERGAMLVLFDGLDEVTTLDERSRLVEKIEHFAQRYPGNRIIVTSRPVGYELTPFSKQWFLHAMIQEFDDDQIHLFLERWYAHVLRLYPLTLTEQQEMEKLYTTLKKNTRLNTLAANPLLLTVIAALHRYEKLPDKRVLIYDRCADLLLETWSKFRGTDVRWKDMKMVKEDQYACVAYLGLALHERSQEVEIDTLKMTDKGRVGTVDSASSDVPIKFMKGRIESFLEKQGLFSSVADVRAEATRFLKLIQEEAGLIVEKGTDEIGETLYGFVHRTFQEYFAAAAIYQDYEEGNTDAISHFLAYYLHEPHWREVILLLFGKLKRKFATAQLRYLLEGRSRLSGFKDILQQDLFFICDCLSEEIAVENELAESIISRLSDLIKKSPFPAQRSAALQSLASLTRSRQYAFSARGQLRELINNKAISSISTRIEIAQTLYQIGTVESEGRWKAMQLLGKVFQQRDLSLEQVVQMSQALYKYPTTSEVQRQATQLLSKLLQQPNLLDEEYVQVAQALYQLSPDESKEHQEATLLLLEMSQRVDVFIEQALQIANTLYRQPLTLEHRQQMIQILLRVIKQSDFSVDQVLQIAQTCYRYLNSSEELRQSVLQMLEAVAQRSDLSAEQTVQVAMALYRISQDEQKKQQAIQMLLAVVQRPDLSAEQIVQVAQDLQKIRFRRPQERIKVFQSILQRSFEFLRHSDLSNELAVDVAEILLRYTNYKSGNLKEWQDAIAMLLTVANQPSLKPEQMVQIVQVLSQISPSGSNEWRRAVELLWQLVQDSRLDLNQRLKLTRLALTMEKPDIPFLASLANQELLPTMIRDEIYRKLNSMIPMFDEGARRRSIFEE